jgi:hypothetical protein
MNLRHEVACFDSKGAASKAKKGSFLKNQTNSPKELYTLVTTAGEKEQGRCLALVLELEWNMKGHELAKGAVCKRYGESTSARERGGHLALKLGTATRLSGVLFQGSFARRKVGSLFRARCQFKYYVFHKSPYREEKCCFNVSSPCLGVSESDTLDCSI